MKFKTLIVAASFSACLVAPGAWAQTTLLPLKSANPIPAGQVVCSTGVLSGGGSILTQGCPLIAGPPGPQGATGPQGPAGPAGSSTGTGSLGPTYGFGTYCNPTSTIAGAIPCHSDSLHLADFGAVGDAIADDTVAIRNWLHACGATGIDCLLDKPARCYKTTSTITNTDSGYRIIGHGGEAANICPNFAAGDTLVFNGNSVEIDNIVIGPSVQQTSGACLHFGAGVTTILIKTVGVFTSINCFNGTFLDQATSFNIDEPLCDAQNYGIQVSFGGDSEITGGDACTALVAGIAFTPNNGAGGLRISNMKINGFGTGAAILLMPQAGSQASDLIVTNSSLEGYATSFAMANPAHATVFGNVIIDGVQMGATTCVSSDPGPNWLQNLTINNVTCGGGSNSTAFNIGNAFMLAITGGSISGHTTAVSIGAGVTRGVISGVEIPDATTRYVNNSSSVRITDLGE